jgi:hypothetical protein
MGIGNLIIGIVIGVIGSTIAWFFIAKNNQPLLLKLFFRVDKLPDDVRAKVKSYLNDLVSKF